MTSIPEPRYFRLPSSWLIACKKLQDGDIFVQENYRTYRVGIFFKKEERDESILKVHGHISICNEYTVPRIEIKASEDTIQAIGTRFADAGEISRFWKELQEIYPEVYEELKQYKKHGI